MQFRAIAFQSEEFRKALALRGPILRYPLGLIYTDEDLEAERENHHLAGFDDETGNLIAMLQLAPDHGDETKLQMRQVAVAENRQAQGLGRKLIAFCEHYASDLGVREIWLHAREQVVPFYEKLGYAAVGEIFLELGIPHMKMFKKLL